MDNEKKSYVAPEYKVVNFNALDVIATTSPDDDCMEIHSYESGTDCHDQELYLPQGE